MTKKTDYTLNAYLAQCGVASRRKAAELVKQGRVTVDDQVVKEPGFRVTGRERIRVEGQPVKQEKKVYILFNKPKNVITTASDELGRKTVFDYFKEVRERLFTIGRLDRYTTGLLLLTNDGEFALSLSHPRYNIEKVYRVELDKPLSKEDFEKIRGGLVLDDGPIKVDDLVFFSQRHRENVRVVLHSGRNRIVRRIFERCGYDVKKLERTHFAGLTTKRLPTGEWRYLTDDEVKLLKRA